MKEVALQNEISARVLMGRNGSVKGVFSEASYASVRMAEWSKAPDSRLLLLPCAAGCSGLRMEAWVQIPLLTHPFFLIFISPYMSHIYIYIQLICLENKWKVHIEHFSSWLFYGGAHVLFHFHFPSATEEAF